MKSTGIVRSLDSVGRVVLPMEIRKEFELFGEDSRVEIFLDEDQIVLKNISRIAFSAEVKKI